MGLALTMSSISEPVERLFMFRLDDVVAQTWSVPFVHGLCCAVLCSASRKCETRCSSKLIGFVCRRVFSTWVTRSCFINAMIFQRHCVMMFVFQHRQPFERG